MSFVSRFLIALALLLAPIAAAAAPAALVTGVVTDGGKPVPFAGVSVTGNSVVRHTKTDAEGRFSFTALFVGTYAITVTTKSATKNFQVDVASQGATLKLDMGTKLIGYVLVGGARTTKFSGGDQTLNRATLSRMPNSRTLPDVLIQLPGAARGANGVIHLNGDHGDINYVVDGVSIPQELNRSLGSEFDPADIAYIEVIEGAYSAQYGERFGGVLNIDTRAQTGPPALGAEVSYGSYAHVDSTVGYHTPLGRGSLSLATRNETSNRGLDPPQFDSPHNAFSNANQFVRLTFPNGLTDALNVTISHAYRTYQIPNDVQNGEPAQTDDNELQDDLFANAQYHHAIGQLGALSFGPSFKRSHIRDIGDPANDFIFGEALNIANGGSPTDCANAVVSGVFGPTTCGYSLSSNRTAADYKFNLDYIVQSGSHVIGAGGFYDATLVNKRYAVTLQPGNFLAPTYNPSDPNGPYTVVDDAPNVGHTEAAYVQDSWRMSPLYELDYGLRADSFQLSSTQFSTAASMWSPRIKVTRFVGSRASVYAYYGRFFTPFSFENVSPQAAQLLNLPLQPTLARFDLRPERDSMYEIGGHLPLGDGDLGIRVWQKNAVDLIDDTQVGVTLLHQDINYQRGRLAMQMLNYQQPLASQGRLYVTVAHEISLNKGCETQLLAPCFGSPTDWTPADHEQRWQATAGAVINDERDGWISVSGEYGSGLSSAICPPGTPGFCKRTPHTIFDLEKGTKVGPKMHLVASIRNVLNDRYYVTLLNAQGNHVAPPRTFDVGIRYNE